MLESCSDAFTCALVPWADGSLQNIEFWVQGVVSSKSGLDFLGF